MIDGKLVITEKNPDTVVEVDWSLLLWSDLLKFTKAQENATPDELQEIIVEMVSRLIGRDAKGLPAMVAMPLIRFVTERLAGGGAASEAPNA